MRLASLLLGLAVLSMTACVQTAEPTADLNGTWAEQVTDNPGGGWMTLSLRSLGSTVVGNGQVCYVGGNCYPGAVIVSGTGVSSFRLSLSDGHGWTAVYAGSVVSHDQLQGTWTDALGTVTLVFNRAP